VQVALEVKRSGGETWSAKVHRAGLAVRHAFVRRSHHDASVAERRRRD
jgi:hypothetical protein